MTTQNPSPDPLLSNPTHAPTPYTYSRRRRRGQDRPPPRRRVQIPRHLLDDSSKRRRRPRVQARRQLYDRRTRIPRSELYRRRVLRAGSSRWGELNPGVFPMSIMILITVVSSIQAIPWAGVNALDAAVASCKSYPHPPAHLDRPLIPKTAPSSRSSSSRRVADNNISMLRQQLHPDSRVHGLILGNEDWNAVSVADGVLRRGVLKCLVGLPPRGRT